MSERSDTKTMSPTAKAALSRTVRALRERLLVDLGESLRGTYKLGLDASEATLGEAAARDRRRIERWTEEQLRASAESEPQEDPQRSVARVHGELLEQAASTLLNRLVYLRLLEGMGLRKTAVLRGGWRSAGYREFRELAPGLVGDASEGYALLLRMVFDELALELPGLFGRRGGAELVPVPVPTLRHVVEQLDHEALASCWGDDMTLGWVYQYWNDPQREALDAKLNAGGKVERHEIASKTQMFTERYMVDWLLQNSLGPMWLAMCEQHGWTPQCERDGTLARLEARRVDWRAKREAGEVEPTELMPLAGEAEARWAYYVPQAIPEQAVRHAPTSVRELKILDPAVGSGHFLVVAFDLLVALYREEAAHRGEVWSDVEIVESVLSRNLHGIDLDPRAVQIAAAALWIKAQQVAPEAQPKAMNLVASQLRLAGLADDDPARVELREAVERETGIPAGLTNEVVEALEGADYLGSLLKVGDVLDRAVAKVAQLRGEREFDAEAAKAGLVAQLERFLSRHTGSADLGLRARGEQLAAGVRFLKLVEEGRYELVVGNPPYQGTAKLADAKYVAKHYARGKADLYAAFLQRGLELARREGVSAMLTMRSWMFIKQYGELRRWLLERFDLRAIGDFDRGAFEGIPDEVVSVVVSVFRRGAGGACASLAHQPTPVADVSRDAERTLRKRAATRCQVGVQAFEPAALRVVPQWPLVYWWREEAELRWFASESSLSARYALRYGVITTDNTRFTRRAWEVRPEARYVHYDEFDGVYPRVDWAPYVTGAKGQRWVSESGTVVRWRGRALAMKVRIQHLYGSVSRKMNESVFFKPGVAVAMIGANFSARSHRHVSIVDGMASSVFSDTDSATITCFLNSARARALVSGLNPTIHFELNDVARLPMLPPADAEEIFGRVWEAFGVHESHREASVEYRGPGPSAWRHAQQWAQLAVDRAEGASLPEYQEVLDAERNSEHISHALGVALGRFGTEALCGKRGILDPARDELGHALPDGILFLDGTLAPEAGDDALGHDACALLRTKWGSHPPEDTKRASLREYLRLDFFPHVHRKMYENRPIHWPLSSTKRTFVAYVTIHRWSVHTLRRLLAHHLHPAKLRLEGRLDDLRSARSSADKQVARASQKALPKLEKVHAELLAFIAEVGTCAERGPASVDPKQHPKRDAVYDPELDDGVMVNASAVWPLLHPQWKDPKTWWKELCTAKGRKDYDWSQLAAKYFPARVEGKCKQDPSLGVAHGCFWRDHPARAYAWELRLQDEIEAGFTIDEEWSTKADSEEPKDSDAAREAFLRGHPQEAEEIRAREDERRKRQAKKQAS